VRPGGGRAKGAAFERWVAIQLRTLFPEARRGYQYRGGVEMPDVIGVDGWRIECKVGRPAKQPLEALAQCENDAMEHEASGGRMTRKVAVCKQDRQEPTATVRLYAVWNDCPSEWAMIPVTMSFGDWLMLLRKEGRAWDTQSSDRTDRR
jgi:hypothetical protein